MGWIEPSSGEIPNLDNYNSQIEEKKKQLNSLDDLIIHAKSDYLDITNGNHELLKVRTEEINKKIQDVQNMQDEWNKKLSKLDIRESYLFNGEKNLVKESQDLENSKNDFLKNIETSNLVFVQIKRTLLLLKNKKFKKCLMIII